MKRSSVVALLAGCLALAVWWRIGRCGLEPLAVAPGVETKRAAGSRETEPPPSPAAEARRADHPVPGGGQAASTSALAPTPLTRLIDAAQEVGRADLPPDPQGRARRVRLVRASFKYPLLRVLETLRREPTGGRETIVGREVVVGDHVIVRVKPEAEPAFAGAVARAGGAIRANLQVPHVYLVAFAPAGLQTVPDAIARLQAESEVVEYAESDGIGHVLSTMPNDPSFGEQWGMHNTGQTVNWGLAGKVDADIDAPEAWDLETGSTNIVVAVTDTGIDYNHPDLSGNLWRNTGEIAGNGIDDDGNGFADDVRGWDFVNNDNDPMDDNGDVSHGTHCAGIVGAIGNNGVGVAGVCWRVRLMAVKSFDSGGNGATSDSVNAIAYSTRMRARLTSNSWGGFSGGSQTLKNVVTEAEAAGILFVAAAGNDGDNTDVTPQYPACFTNANIISVANSNNRDLRQSSSNYGLKSVDLAAPGHNIYSCQRNNAYQFLSGTSMATPCVAGACALLLSHSPRLSVAAVKQALLGNVDPNSDFAGKCVSGGRLNVQRALASLDLFVYSTVPGAGEVRYSPPTRFTVTFTDPYAAASVAAADFTVNGLVANSFELTSAKEVAFTFAVSPVSAEGAQTMAIAAGAIGRQRDGRGIAAWSDIFRYDATVLAVTSSVPASGATVTLQTTNVVFSFNEAIDAGSVAAADLQLSQGTVTGVAVLNATTVSFAIGNTVSEGTIALRIPAGAILDVYGNPCAAYTGTLLWDFGRHTFPAAFVARRPLGSLVYDAQLRGSIGLVGDVDRFDVLLDAGQTLAVGVGPTGGALQPVVEVRDPGGALVTNVSAAVPGQGAVTLPLPLANSGAYALAIAGAAGSTGGYSLRLVLNAAVERETYGGAGNDVPGAAQELDGSLLVLTNGMGRAAVLGGGSEDWYAVSLISNEVVTLAVAALTSGVSRVALHDGSGALMASGIGGQTNMSQFIDRVRIGVSGTYYARVTGGAVGYNLVLGRNACVETEPHTTRGAAQDISGSGGAVGYLRAIGPLPAEVEPNDDGVKNGSLADLAFANDLSSSFAWVSNNTYRANVTGRIGAGADADWDFFKFWAGPGDSVELRLNRTDSAVDPYVRLLDRNATQLAFSDDGPVWPNSLATYSSFSYAGEYYAVADCWGNDIGTYELILQLTTTTLRRTPVEDHYAVDATAGNTLTVSTLTPGYGATPFVNDLDPAIEVYNAAGTLVAGNDNGAPDGRNARLSYAVPSTGVYTVRVTPVGYTGGEYALGVSGVAGVVRTFQVTSSTPANGALLKVTPTQMTVSFSRPVLFTSLQAADLKIDGVACTGYTVTDGDTVVFDLPALVDGPHGAAIAAGAAQDALGTALSAWSASFTTDTRAPRVIASSIAEGGNVLPGNLTYTATISERLVSSQVNTGAVSLVGAAYGARSGTVGYTSTSSNATITVTYANLPPDYFTLTLRSGNGRLEDPAGNDLDGEFGGALPSGNGVEGGDFVLHFYTEAPSTALPSFTAREPLGSQVYGVSVDGYVGPVGDVDGYTVNLDAGQLLSVLVRTATNLQPVIAVSGPGGALTNASAPAARQCAILQNWPVNAAGTYTITVSGANGTIGGFTLEAALNAAFEWESVNGTANDTPAAAEDLDTAFLALTGAVARAAVWAKGDPLGPDGAGYRAIGVPYEFQDISGTGYNDFSSTDDASVAYPSDHPYLNGFTFGFYGSTRDSFGLTSNGLLTFGGGESSGANTDLTAAPSYASIAAFWDDLHTRNGRVYFQVLGSGDNQKFIVQWHNCEFKSGQGQGTITFQVVLNEADGTIQINYRDLASGYAAGSEGAGATVGIKDSGTQGTRRLLISQNTAGGRYAGTGKSLRIGTGVALGTGYDVYACTLAAGERLTLAASADGSATNIALNLLDGAGSVVAAGQAFANVEQAVLGYVAPSAGRYVVRVRGPADGNYALTAVRNAVFDCEANDAAATAQDLAGCGAALGYLPGAANSDYYVVNAVAGDTIRAATQTPGGGSGEFVNGLNPALELYNPGGSLVAGNNDGAPDGKNARLTYAVAGAGRYVVRVKAQSGSGEYVLSAVAVPPTPTVTLTAPDAAATEEGVNGGQFRVTRNLGTNATLTVRVALGGSASNGVDYATLAQDVTLAVGAVQATVPVTPVSDGLAEGDETVTMVLRPSAAYGVGSPSQAVVTVTDAPWDAWRWRYFGEEGNDPAVAGAAADADSDGMPNEHEYRAGTVPTDFDSLLRLDMVGVGALDFDSVSGHTYAVEYRQRLTDPSWQAVTAGVSGTGGAIPIADPGAAGATQRFYRVRVTAP